MWQFLGNAVFNLVSSEEGWPFVGYWGLMKGHGSENRTEILRECSMGKSVPDFAGGAGFLSLSLCCSSYGKNEKGTILWWVGGSK